MGFLGMRITKGHFEDTQLDGVSFFAVASFPGPLQGGHSTLAHVVQTPQGVVA